MKKLFSAISLSLTLLFAATTAQAAVKIGQAAPNFTLNDVKGQAVSLSDFKGKYVVLEWTNPECPFVRKHYGSGSMQNLQRTYTAKGVVWLSINSSAPGREGHCTPNEARLVAAGQGGAATDILLDDKGVVGHLYDAKTTPQMFIITPAGALAYMGAIDSIPSHDIPDLAKARNYVASALDELLAGKPVTAKTSVPYGCSVKYAK